MANRLEHKGLTAGTFCSRTSQASVRTINHSMIPQYDPDEAIKNGKLVQQQRARERAIRDAKKRLRVAEQLGDDQMVSQTKTLLRARQAKLRDFIKETNAGKKNPILVRDYSREKIVTKIPIIKVNESELISKTVQPYGSFL